MVKMAWWTTSHWRSRPKEGQAKPRGQWSSGAVVVARAAKVEVQINLLSKLDGWHSLLWMKYDLCLRSEEVVIVIGTGVVVVVPRVAVVVIVVGLDVVVVVPRVAVVVVVVGLDVVDIVGAVVVAEMHEHEIGQPR